MYEYTAYGLAIHSEIPLPELTEHPVDEPDVRIQLGGVPDALDAPRDRRVAWSAGRDEWLFNLGGIGSFYVTGGTDIRIEPAPEADLADVRAFLFSSTWGALLHQRGALVLHASAVQTPGGAVIVSGRAGAGKSTLLAALLQRGYPLLADDKVAVIDHDGHPTLLPGYPTVRLWDDALDRMGVPLDGLPRLREGVDKYLYRAPAFHTSLAPARALFSLRLSQAPGVEIRQMNSVDAFSAVYHGTYRARIVRAFGRRRAHFAQVSAFVGAVPVFRLERPRETDSVAALVDAIEGTVTTLAPV